MTVKTTKTLTLPTSVQRFKRSDDYLRTYSERVLPYPSVRAKFRQFMELKRKNPNQSFGSSDTSFISTGNYGKIPGLRHAHITQDLSIVYRVINNVIYLYGFYTHKDLGTGDTARVHTQKSMADKFQNTEFYENDEQHRETLRKTGFWGTRGAGCIFLALDTKKIGVALRSSYVQSPNTLGTVGGAIDENDDPKTTTKKEVLEEVGYNGELKLIPLLVSNRKTRNGSDFIYYNFLGIVPKQFTPKLNWENDDLLWMTLDELKSQSNLHVGLKMLLNDISSINIIKKYSNENINEDILTEGSTDKLFYYRRLNGALKTLEDGYFSLSSSTGNDAEEKYAPPGKPFFLSTTRSKVGDYHRWVGSGAVMFNLDGRWIGQRYTVKPLDYWYAGKTPDTLKKGEWKTLEPTAKRAMWNYSGSERTSESEDRIFSSDNTMPLTPVTSVHIYYAMDKLSDEKDDQIKTYGAYVNRIIKLCGKRRIPVFIYNDVDNWKTQNMMRSIKPDYVLKLTSNFEMPKPYQGMKFMGPWVELIKAGSMTDLSKDADKLRYNITYYGDSITRLNNDLHNARTPKSGDYEDVVFINKFMLHNKLKNTRQLLDYLKDKWQNISKMSLSGGE